MWKPNHLCSLFVLKVSSGLKSPCLYNFELLLWKKKRKTSPPTSVCRGHRSTWEFSCRAAEIIINSNYILENGEWVPLSRSNKTIPTLFHPLTKQKRATIQRPLRRKKSIIIIRYPVTGERHGSVYSLTTKNKVISRVSK